MESIYKIEDIMEHNKRDDCWIVINNIVYDITDFIDDHPGGDSILITVAGTDASNFFNELHRPELLEEIAINYKIGIINE